MSAGLVADVGGNLAQVSSQVKMVEEDYVEEFNPWNRDVQLLERMLESQDSMQKEIIMREGKDEREEEQVGMGEKVRISGKQVRVRIRQLQREEQQIEELVNNNNNLKQRERGRSKWQSIDQSKDVLEMDIEELWNLMMKQAIGRKMIVAGRMIN